MTPDPERTFDPRGTARPLPRPRVGVFGIGLAAYWEQFPGMRERLAAQQAAFEARLGELGADVVAGGLVDTAQSARATGDRFAQAQVDLVVCNSLTYATASTMLPVVQAAKTPVLLVGLQDHGGADYAELTTNDWLAGDAICCIPELAGALTRGRLAFDTVAGTVADDRVWSRIAAWIRGAGAARELSRARLGFMGHTYPGMLDMYSDFTAFHTQLGAHVEVLEVEDLGACVAAATAAEISAKEEEIRATFAFADPSHDPIAGPIDPAALAWSTRVAVGLDRLVERYELSGLTYYYRGLDDNEHERLIAGAIIGNSLLTARGIPTSGEGDLKTNVSQLMLDRLGAGGSFTEFYALDYDEDFVLMGHDGPGHIAIADERPVLRALKLFHGKSGSGLSVEFNVKLGPITIVCCTQTAEGRLKLIVGEGESIAGPTMQIGNTNSRLRFALPPGELFERWCAEGPTHHVALGVGHRALELRNLARLLDLEYVQVT